MTNQTDYQVKNVEFRVRTLTQIKIIMQRTKIEVESALQSIDRLNSMIATAKTSDVEVPTSCEVAVADRDKLLERKKAIEIAIEATQEKVELLNNMREELI